MTGTPSGSAASTETRSERMHVDAQREVAVLLDRAERQNDPIVRLEVRLNLHPVQVDDPHRVTLSYSRATDSRSSSSFTGAASWRPAGRLPSAIPQGSEIAGAPVRL